MHPIKTKASAFLVKHRLLGLACWIVIDYEVEELEQLQPLSMP